MSKIAVPVISNTLRPEATVDNELYEVLVESKMWNPITDVTTGRITIYLNDEDPEAAREEEAKRERIKTRLKELLGQEEGERLISFLNGVEWDGSFFIAGQKTTPIVWLLGAEAKMKLIREALGEKNIELPGLAENTAGFDSRIVDIFKEEDAWNESDDFTFTGALNLPSHPTRRKYKIKLLKKRLRERLEPEEAERLITLLEENNFESSFFVDCY